eukprot:g10002.t1
MKATGGSADGGEYRSSRRYGRQIFTNPTEADSLMVDRHAYVRIEDEDGKRRKVMKWLGAAAVIGLLALGGLKRSNVATKDIEDTTATLQAGGSNANYLADLESMGQDKIASGDIGTGGTFNLVATNEYGEYDRRALALYALNMVIEPYKNTTITALPKELAGNDTSTGFVFYWYIHKADDFGVWLGGYPPEVSKLGSSSLTVNMREPGQNYWMWVAQIKDDYEQTGHVEIVAEALDYISCKYVRRELRDLSSDDSAKFFTAMRRFNTVSLEDGRRAYGSTFANAKIMAAYHASQNFCFYRGLQFNIAHAAMSLWAERSLQMIDPAVPLAYWDLTRETSELGASWTASEIFSDQMFGSAIGKASEHYRLEGDWFPGLTSLFDPRDKFVNEKINPGHNPWGFIDSKYSYERSGDVTRTASYCGMESELEFSTCNVVKSCFEDNNNVNAWSTCMENGVLQGTHGMIGGAYDCSTSMEKFRQEHPEYTRGLLSFAAGFIVTQTWPTNSLMAGHNECDEHCLIGSQNQTCGCRCTTDPFEWSDEEVLNFMRPTMEAMSEFAHGDKYVFLDSTATYETASNTKKLETGFMQDGLRLDSEATLRLLRQLLVVACEPGALGAMAGAAAPMDPIYFAVHPMFEKALHILALSPSYNTRYEFEWVEHGCGDGVSGGAIDDKLPFTERYLGVGDSSEFLTNAEIWTIINPKKRSLPYVYDKFETWGSCKDWHFDV